MLSVRRISILAVIFTGHSIPLWTVYAYTSGLVLLGIGRIPLRLFGYNGLWERVAVPQTEPAGG